MDLTVGLPSVVILPSHCKPRCKLEMRKVTQHNHWSGHLRSMGKDRQGLRTSQFEEGSYLGFLVPGLSGEGAVGRQGLVSPSPPGCLPWLAGAQNRASEHRCWTQTAGFKPQLFPLISAVNSKYSPASVPQFPPPGSSSHKLRP